MMSFLKQLSLAIGLMGSDHDPVADLDGWKNYVWRIRPVEQCGPRDPRGFCTIVSDRWDWKRPQFYSLGYAVDGLENGLTVRLELRNEDPEDQDMVCIVAIFFDGDDKEIAAFFQNWPGRPGRPITREIPLKPLYPVTSIAKVAVGSKPCSVKPVQDAANFYKLRSRIRQR